MMSTKRYGAMAQRCLTWTLLLKTALPNCLHIVLIFWSRGITHYCLKRNTPPMSPSGRATGPRINECHTRRLQKVYLLKVV